MIASRGNVILAFLLGIYLILGFSTISVFSEKEEWSSKKRQAFQKAGCIANFRNDVSVNINIVFLSVGLFRRIIDSYVSFRFDKSDEG